MRCCYYGKAAMSIVDEARRRGAVLAGDGRQLLLSYVHICPSSGIIA